MFYLLWDLGSGTRDETVMDIQLSTLHVFCCFGVLR